MTFLIKESPSAEFITNSIPGQTKIDFSIPQGKGFQIDEYFFGKYQNDFPTTNIILCAAGSGIAPIAAAIDSGKLQLRKTGYNSIFETTASLYVGAKTEAHLPFKDRYDDWEKNGVKV